MRLYERALGIVFIASVLVTTLWVGPKAGAMVLGAVTFLFSLFGLVFKKEISLAFFKRVVVLRGRNFKFYCLGLMLIGAVVFFNAANK
jgi:hypothetical protein